ncbi:hypothetical protein N7925_03435 [Streptomyces sp. CA-278952]|uniref:hypothetical protein n=1 Tax=unclassified Streptomyces TaxID=2593676 RepID=UPI0023678140|nr:hypothetical protein [Streptomyces sp. CA-278952]WDG27451.1 hypothetical protein N7925_03435 [Streptomyces sp. CA-278952]
MSTRAELNGALNMSAGLAAQEFYHLSVARHAWRRSSGARRAAFGLGHACD